MAKNKEIAVIGLRGFPNIQGGVEKHCEALYTRLPQQKFRVYRRKPYIVDKADGRYPNIAFTDLPSTKIAGFEAALHTLLAALDCAWRRPQTVHVHNIGPGLFIPLLKLFGLNVVMTYHSTNYEHAKWSPLAKKILRLGEKLSMRWADRVIFVNKKKYDELHPIYPDKTYFLPNGVNPMTPAETTDFIQSLGLTPGSYLLSVGRLTPEKGFDSLIQAINSLPENLQLVIAGGSDNDDTYARKLKDLDTRNRVIFTGNVQGTQLSELYTHARAYILSSINEGFPLVLLEAMQHHLPILASDIPASHLPGITNFFHPASPSSLAAAIPPFLAEADAHPRVNYDMTPYDWSAIALRTLPLLHFPSRS